MFPEITRDEVFRIETPHLWLRWPTCADADAVADVLAQGYAKPDPTDYPALIRRWRAEMEAGLALHLALAPKGRGHVIGVIHAQAGAAIRCRLLAGDAARPLGAEAIEAAQTMLTWLGAAPDRRERPMTHQRGLFLRAEFAGWCCAQA